MSNIYRLIKLLLLVTLLPALAFPQRDWKGLYPLKSTLSDVGKMSELILVRNLDNFAMYETTLDKISIWYASGHCNPKLDTAQWRVKKGVITRISVKPKETVLLSSLKVDLEQFKYLPDPFHRNHATYRSDDGSCEIDVIQLKDKRVLVSQIDYIPGNEMLSLKCKK